MYFHDVEEQAKANTNFRRVIYTGANSQLVLMSIAVGEDIGMETHHGIDQILFIVDGHAKSVVDGQEQFVEEDDVVFVPAETAHNFVNTGDEPLKLYTVYSPPAHKDGTVHATKADAEKEEAY